MAWMAMIPMAMSAASSMMGAMNSKNQNNPYDAAGAAYNPYISQMTQGFQPYINAGTNALSNYQNSLNPMANSSDYINNIMKQWQMSPAAQDQINEGIKASGNANSQSGMVGSGAQQKGLADYAQKLTDQDQQQWFQNNMGVTGQYQQGEANMMNNGLQSQGMLSQLLAQIAQMQAGNAYGSAQFGNNQSGDMMGSLMSFANNAPGTINSIKSLWS